MKAFILKVLEDPSFLGTLIGAVLSSIIAILIYKHGNKNEKENQRIILISRKLYLLQLFKNDLERLKLSITSWEREESILNHSKRVKGYFLLFDDKVLSQEENKHLLLWHDWIVRLEYYFLFSASDVETLDKIMRQMNELLGETDKLIAELIKGLKK